MLNIAANIFTTSTNIPENTKKLTKIFGIKFNLFDNIQ